MRTKINQHGFHVIEFIIIIAVIGVVGLAGWKVFGSKKDTNTSAKQDVSQNNVASKPDEKASSKFVEWSFNGESWQAVGAAPKCDEPLSIKAPIDLSRANSKLLPGQVRGGDYKPHGGLGLDFSAYQNKVEVVAMADAYLYRGSRYIEAGEVQYMIDLMNSCGVMYRYDHLLTLSPEFAKHITALPEPKVDDSRTTKFSTTTLIKAGSIIATEVGFRNMKNPGFDIGVYDLRQPNEASKTSTFKTDAARLQDKEQSYYSVCWFDLLPEKDKAAAKALPLRNQNESTSDFCKV
jgi:hypothetical protein